MFLGVDLSTQGVKAVVVDQKLQLVAQIHISFDADLPHYKTKNGCHRGEDGVVTAPAEMWLEGVDLVMDRLQSSGLDMSQIAGVCGSAQQHGSVWWNQGAWNALHLLQTVQSANASLLPILSSALATNNSPIWMDTSTHKQCVALEEAIGGAEQLCSITGSRAFERFTGNQIAKMYQTQRAVYQRTDRISLVSAFLSSLFIGAHAPSDVADASGMNLMNIHTKKWEPSIVSAVAPGLASKLGDIVSTAEKIGTIAEYFVIRYGFDRNCEVFACSGDNPCTVAALLQEAGQAAVSLGTSDTLTALTAHASPNPMLGHVLVSPLSPSEYMLLLCYQNGSLAREWVRDKYCHGSWPEFYSALGRTPPGNNGLLGVYYLEPPIAPHTSRTGIFRVSADDCNVSEFSDPLANVRALVEWQCMVMRNHSAALGLKPTSLVLAGGGATEELAQVLADVFGVVVLAADTQQSAAYGAAILAAHRRPPAPTTVLAQPRAELTAMYQTLCTRLASLEAQIVADA